VDDSAPTPTKDAASCDMPREGACNLRSGDLRMRLRAAVSPQRPGNPGRCRRPTERALPRRKAVGRPERGPGRERPEAKHHSRGRKRKQRRCPK